MNYSNVISFIYGFKVYPVNWKTCKEYTQAEYKYLSKLPFEPI